MSEFKLYPQIAVWEITFKCNMRCIHCGTSAGVPRDDELTTNESLKLCDELAELGCTSLTLSGGEPLLRTDWQIIAKQLKRNGISIGIVSNGLLIDNSTVEKFSDIGFGMIGISIDGIAQTHNMIRNRPDSYDTVISAFELLRKNNKLRFCAVTQVCKYNLNELELLYQILTDLGVPLWQIQLTTFTGRMKSHPSAILDYNGLTRLAKFIITAKRRRQIEIDVGENIGYYNYLENALRDGAPYLGCYAGCRVIGIESNGNIKGCLSLPEEFVEGNIRVRSLKDIWYDMNNFAYNRKFTLDKVQGFCRKCQYLTRCRCGCSNTGYGMTGSRFNNPLCLYRMEQELEL